MSPGSSKIPSELESKINDSFDHMRNLKKNLWQLEFHNLGQVGVVIRTMTNLRLLKQKWG